MRLREVASKLREVTGGNVEVTGGQVRLCEVTRDFFEMR